MYQEKDIPYYRIMDAFLEQYQKETQAMSLFLDILDETERREAIAKSVPHASKFLESHTRQELETNLMIVAIASSVAKAIFEANHILH